MIKIRRDSIKRVLELTDYLKKNGKYVEPDENVRKRIELNHPFLYDTLCGVIRKYEKCEKNDQERKILQLSYIDGFYITYQILEFQVRKDMKELPEITYKDVDIANKRFNIIHEMWGDDSLIKKLEHIKKENQEFGNFVENTVLNYPKGSLIAFGFLNGVFPPYSYFQEAYARTKI